MKKTWFEKAIIQGRKDLVKQRNKAITELFDRYYVYVFRNVDNTVKTKSDE
jgi:hypothetical protein